MRKNINPELWKKTIESEYLGRYMSEGGSFVKFVNPVESIVRRDLSQFLGQQQSRGIVLTTTDASKVRIHFMQDLFFSVASQIPWRKLSRDLLFRLSEAQGFRSPERLDDARGVGALLAEANGTTTHAILLELRPAIDSYLLKDRLLTIEFATAAMNLVLAELLEDSESSTRRGSVVSWLTGANRSIAPVKPYRIFSKIGRANSRGLLQSLSRFIGLSGSAGWLWVLDLARVTAVAKAESVVRYNRSSLLDVYEVLRQFIDAVDTFQGLGLISVVPGDFMSTDAKYGVHIYPALYNRLSDEVRHPVYANPLNSFASLSFEAAEPVQ